MKEPEFTQRIPRLVGRKDEIERLQKALQARGEKHCFYYWAEGGLGKTRLLQELQTMVIELGPGYHSSDIIDLFQQTLIAQVM
jgi:hypothetical protein